MSVEVTKVLNDLNTAFEQFKAANDERIKQIEAKGSADAALTEKVEKANQAVSDLQAKLNALETQVARPRVVREDGREISPEAQAYREAFNQFARTGDDSGLRSAQNAMSVGSDPDGGYAVPEELDREILDLIREVSPMRQVANVVTVGTSNYRKLVNKHGAGSGWVGETATRTETATAQLAELTPYWGEVYANPQVTQSVLDDVFFNVESWHAGEVQLEFAVQEGSAFLSGNGINKPKGFLAYLSAATTDKAGRAFGTLQYIASGAAGALPTNPDKYVDMVQALKAPLRAGAVWMANSLSTGSMRKMKDANGQYYWQPSTQAGQPATFLGYGVVEAEDMPDVAADALPVAFGNFRRGYTIVDRLGIRVLRDPFTNKPYVGFYTTKRVGGFVADSEAIKLLKAAAA
jgi:HK97 family phage major capsid protein